MIELGEGASGDVQRLGWEGLPRWERVKRGLEASFHALPLVSIVLSSVFIGASTLIVLSRIHDGRDLWWSVGILPTCSHIHHDILSLLHMGLHFCQRRSEDIYITSQV